MFFAQDWIITDCVVAYDNLMCEFSVLILLKIDIHFIFTDEWVMFDDDKVTGITIEDILKLSGGGMYNLIVIFCK